MSDSESQNPPNATMARRAQLWGIYAVSILLALAFIWNPLAERLRLFLPLLPVTVAALAFATSYRMTGRTLFAASVIIVMSFLCSASGAYFGFPFGDIVYTHSLGPKLLDVPVGIPFLWLAIVLPSWTVAGKALKFQHVIVASIVVTAFDSVLEFAADALDLWHWQGGAPTELNYLSWFGIAWCSFTLLRKFATEREESFLAPHVLGAQILFLIIVDAGHRYIAPLL